jgi:hypothetical protein
MAVQTNKNRVKSLFFILISIASFANANFGINNSNYQEKQAVVPIFNHKRYDYRALQAIKGNLNETFCIVDFIHFSFIGLRRKK